jgi:D-alanyl-D-alanine carboxypeptidase (penicillin-binding protein 5/6)
VALALRLRRNNFIRRLVNQPSITLHSGVRPRTFANRNDLVRTVDWINGIKTGHTLGAGYVLVGAGRLSGLQLISAVAGARSEAGRDADTRALLTWARRQVRRVTAARAGASLDPPVSVPIRYRPGAELELLVGRTQRRLVPAGEGNPFTVRPLAVPDEVEGPLAPGEQVGRAAIMQGDRRIATVPLVAAAGVPAAGLGQKTKAAFTRAPVIVLAFAVLGGTVLLARRRRRGSRPGRRRPSEEPRAA